ncbi:MBL fold metallo-hydrolase [Halorarum halobium]|uniref:MBL fold metallo-hydrolase n=1 Tax=Halorarum halobium TaxID=3075121 RepID=UPI0028AD2919|nr:MBL fold metallo-hydrolase [Halobaculum sp. XH14]
MTGVTEIQDGVYDVTAKTFADGRRYRVFLVDGETPTLFDTGFADGADETVARIEETGMTPERIVLTHGDHDHVGGLGTITEAFDADVWASAQTDLDGHEPDHVYDDGDTIGGFEALHVPGHKEDSYAFVDEDRGVMVSGDVVSGSDQRGMPAGYPVLPPAAYSTDLIALEEGLERLLDYSFDVILVFHGSSILEEGRDRLDRFVNFPGKPE